MSEVIAHGSLEDGNAIRSYRPRLALPFGGGLDRSTATVAASREIARDLVNLLPREGKVRIRPGIALVAQSLVTTGGATMDRIVEGEAFEIEQANIVVGYHDATRELHVFRASTDGSVSDHLGLWGTVPAGAQDPPKAVLTEFQGRMFLAHDERAPLLRLGTYYWDPFTSNLAALEAEWGGEGEPLETLRFRGVAVHLDYLVGWGYGTATEDRPDLIRTSLPGLAVYPVGHSKAGTAAFDIQHYAAVGNPADPVTLCAPAGGALMVCKDSITYPFVGFSPRNFGVGPSNEHRFGVAHARLGIYHAGDLYLWTDEGPRVTNGGPLEDLELPLDIAGPSPADLADAGELEDGFCVYVPVQRILVWVFGRRAYALSLRQPSKGLRWAYWEFGVALEAGWSAFTTPDAATTASPGHPEWTSESVESNSADVTVTNVDHLGDEWTELWLKPSGGAWALHRTVKVSLESSQIIPATGLASGTAYDGALRYRRGAGIYDSNYSDPDPSLWPAVSRGSFSTGLAGDGAVTAGWTRTSSTDEQIDLAFADFDPAATIEVERKVRGEDDTSYVMLTGTPLAAGTLGYTDDGFPDGEVYYVYRITETLPDSTRVHTITRWAGPDAHSDLVQTHLPASNGYDDNWYKYRLAWGQEYAGVVTVIHDDYYCQGTFQTRPEVATDIESTSVGPLEKSSPDNDAGDNGVPALFTVRVWAKLTSFTVDDFSPRQTLNPFVRRAADETFYNECGANGTGGAPSGSEPDEELI